MTDIAICDSGVKLAASVYGPAEAEPILFLHGLSMSRDNWEEVTRRFSDRYRVWTLDFRGHGDSDRATTYQVADFLHDAETALAWIGQPAIVVGHSIGAVVTGTLAQNGHPLVRAAYLEEPPWYLGEISEWERTPFPKKFAGIAAMQAQWQAQSAPLSHYQAFLASLPSPSGGTIADHTSPRHLLSHASALYRQDNICWRDSGPGDGGQGLSATDTSRPFQRPTQIVVGEVRLGSALLDDHAERLKAVNPGIKILRYSGCGHDPHRTIETEKRFADDLSAFVALV